MNWFLISIGAPLLWAMTNQIDKYILSRYFEHTSVGTLMIFSSVTGLFMLPILYAVNPTVTEIPVGDIAVLLFVSALGLSVLWLYFEALRDEEASTVVIFYQLIPVFAGILGYLILDEALTPLQIVAMLLILAGAIIISVEIDDKNNFRLKRRTIILMTLAAAISALESVLFKFVAVQGDVWVSLFWAYVGIGFMGVCLFCIVKSYRDDFLRTLRTRSAPILSLNGVNEALYIAGNTIFAYAYMLAPVALVLLVSAFQPFFVLVIGVVLTLLLPKFAAETLTIRSLGQKGVAITVVGVGTYLLLM